MPALPPFRSRSATRPVRRSSHGEALAFMTPMLEELSEFEVELPAGSRAPLGINLVEPIPDVYAQRSKRTQRAHAESGAPEEARWVELARLRPDVTALEESVDIEGLVDPEAKLSGADEESVAERCPACLRLIGVRVVPARRNRELVVAAKRFAVLSAANRKRLGVEERPCVPEHCPGP